GICSRRLWPTRSGIGATAGSARRPLRSAQNEPSPMTRVLSGAVLVGIAIVVVWFAPIPIFDAVAFALLFAAGGGTPGVFVAGVELVALFGASGVVVPLWPTALAALLTLATFADPIAGQQRPLEITIMAAMIGLAGVILGIWRGSPGAMATISAALFPLPYLA